MTYFEDLSDYAYRSTPIGQRPKNVGWLGPDADFKTAEPDAEFLELLWQHCAVSVLQTRGLHECHLCAPHESNVAEKNGKQLLLGSAEIRVFSRFGEIYAAPNLVYHYVSVHKYRPPEQFVEAVKKGLRPSSKEYFDRLSEIGLAWSPTLVPDEHAVRFRFVRTRDGVKRVEE